MLKAAQKSEGEDREVSLEQIKQITGKFDPKIITFLDLSGRGLSSIKNITQCTNLKFLSLSQNRISFLFNLKGLVALQFLDLSQNSVSDISELRSMNELLKLKLEGNAISESKQIACLKDLRNLSHLSFANFDGSLQNPICKAANYRETVLEKLPNLATLDYLGAREAVEATDTEKDSEEELLKVAELRKVIEKTLTDFDDRITKMTLKADQQKLAGDQKSQVERNFDDKLAELEKRLKLMDSQLANSL